jgi:uncharacterized membrane protein YqiK
MALSFVEHFIAETKAPFKLILSKTTAEVEVSKAEAEVSKAKAEVAEADAEVDKAQAKKAKAEVAKAEVIKVQAKRQVEFIILILKNKFETIPPYVEKKVNSLTRLDVLRKVYKIVRYSQDITDFWNKIYKL